jgi:hypothetical protein
LPHNLGAGLLLSKQRRIHLLYYVNEPKPPGNNIERHALPSLPCACSSRASSRRARCLPWDKSTRCVQVGGRGGAPWLLRPSTSDECTDVKMASFSVLPSGVHVVLPARKLHAVLRSVRRGCCALALTQASTFPCAPSSLEAPAGYRGSPFACCSGLLRARSAARLLRVCVRFTER